MKALVTGGAGFIGSTLAEALLARGDEVVSIDCLTPYYDPSDKQRNLAVQVAADRCEVLADDLRRVALDKVLDGVDVVFHQAAQPGVRASWDEGFGDYAAHNILVTQRLLDAVRDRPITRFVYASSSSIYGNALEYPTTEDQTPAPFSPYGVTKLAAEHLCRAYAQNFGVPTISLRYFTVFGPRQRPDMGIHRLIESALRGTEFPLFGDGSQVREFTYVDDVVAANLLAADLASEPGSVCNIAGGAEIELRDLIELVGQLVGEAVRLAPRPAEPGDVRRNGGSTELARQILGWSPQVELTEGILRQVEWHRARVLA